MAREINLVPDVKEEMIKLFRSFDFSATDVGCKG